MGTDTSAVQVPTSRPALAKGCSPPAPSLPSHLVSWPSIPWSLWRIRRWSQELAMILGEGESDRISQPPSCALPLGTAGLHAVSPENLPGGLTTVTSLRSSVPRAAAASVSTPTVVQTCSRCWLFPHTPAVRSWVRCLTSLSLQHLSNEMEKITWPPTFCGYEELNSSCQCPR